MNSLSQYLAYLLLAVIVTITNTASALQPENRQGVVLTSTRFNLSVPSNGIAHQPRFYTDKYRAEKDNRYLTKRQVINQVKKRYQADVLRINFDAQREMYRVKILTKKGHVKFVTVNARR